MRLPNESASSWVHLAFAGFVYASLVAWRETDLLTEAQRVKISDLADALKPKVDALLKEARETQDALIFNRPTAQARQNVALVALKRLIKETLQAVVTKLGNASDTHPEVRTFLPKLSGGITTLRLADRSPATIRAVGRLRKISDFDGKEALAIRLEQVALNAGRMVLAAEGAYGAWETERSEEVVAKGHLRLGLESTHRALGAEFPGQREFVESFFLRSEKASEGEVDADDGGGEPT